MRALLQLAIANWRRRRRERRDARVLVGDWLVVEIRRSWE